MSTVPEITRAGHGDQALPHHLHRTAGDRRQHRSREYQAHNLRGPGDCYAHRVMRTLEPAEDDERCGCAGMAGLYLFADGNSRCSFARKAREDPPAKGSLTAVRVAQRVPARRIAASLAIR
jgi:hypothetical protein